MELVAALHFFLLVSEGEIGQGDLVVNQARHVPALERVRRECPDVSRGPLAPSQLLSSFWSAV